MSAPINFSPLIYAPATTSVSKRASFSLALEPPVGRTDRTPAPHSTLLQPLVPFIRHLPLPACIYEFSQERYRRFLDSIRLIVRHLMIFLRFDVTKGRIINRLIIADDLRSFRCLQLPGSRTICLIRTLIDLRRADAATFIRIRATSCR